jgi:PAS domain S-box-containing protein
LAVTGLEPLGHDVHYREIKRKHVIRLFLTYVLPLIVLSIYFFFQHASIVKEGRNLHLAAVAEGHANAMNFFLSERVENLHNLMYGLNLDGSTTSRDLDEYLAELQRDSGAFVDLGLIDSSGVQFAYTGPFPSLQRASYELQTWYQELRRSASDHLVTDIHLGRRKRPHFTVAVKKRVGDQQLVLVASLNPEKIYEHINSWGGTGGVRIYIVNKKGDRQLATPGGDAVQELAPFLPPERPRVGTSEFAGDDTTITYAYSWLLLVDWALIVHPISDNGPAVFSGLGTRILVLAGLLVLIGLVGVNVGAKKLTELQMESDRAHTQLTERVKELRCLFGISRIVETPGISTEEILGRTLRLVCEALRFPESACARITLDDKEFRTEPWADTSWTQVADITVNRQKVGQLQIAYIEEKPEAEEGPFLKEERDLIHAVAERLGRIIERRRASAQQSMLTTAIEQAAESVVITDIDGHIQYVNPAFTKISGYGREEVFGKNPRILQSGKHDKVFYRKLWETILDGRTWEGRLTNKSKNGTLYEVDCLISPVKNERGVVTNFVAVKHDVTEMVKLESNLRQVQKMEAVGQLAGGVAHDFNNLLTVILTNVHYMLKGLGDSSPLRQDIEEIKQSGERAASLTRQLLAFSRQQIIEPRIVNLNQIVEGTEKMLRRLIGEHIELETGLAEDLGLVYVDPAQVEQVILNLAVNARDAMPEGGKLTVETANVSLDEDYSRLHSDVRPGPFVMLVVTDTGSGMDESTQSRIFEPFFTTKEQGKGTGLGLSTVYGVVKQCGGHVWVRSVEGEGTIFKIYFPREEKKLDSGAGQEISRDTLHGSETVLVVEDESSVRRTAVRILRENDYRVLEAGNGREALDLCEAHPGSIDLLITDLIMPEMGGKRLSEFVADSFPDIKVLFMSGYGKVHDEPSDGSGVFVQKPLVPSELAAKVREILDREAKTPKVVDGSV